MVWRSIKVAMCRWLEIILVRPYRAGNSKRLNILPEVIHPSSHTVQREWFSDFWKGDLVNTSQWSHTIMFSYVECVKAIPDWKSLCRSRASRMVEFAFMLLMQQQEMEATHLLLHCRFLWIWYMFKLSTLFLRIVARLGASRELLWGRGWRIFNSQACIWWRICEYRNKGCFLKIVWCRGMY